VHHTLSHAEGHYYLLNKVLINDYICYVRGLAQARLDDAAEQWALASRRLSKDAVGLDLPLLDSVVSEAEDTEDAQDAQEGGGDDGAASS
jgi:hypothetical protein